MKTKPIRTIFPLCCIAWLFSNCGMGANFAAADVSFAMQNGFHVSWCQFCADQTWIYDGRPPQISMDGIDIIQSARLVLDMGPFIIESASIDGLPGDFKLNVERVGDLTIVELSQISTTDINQTSANIILHNDHTRIRDVGLGYGALRILSAEVHTQTGFHPEIKVSDGSWYIGTDYAVSISITIISSTNGNPVQNIRVWLTGLDEWPDMFAFNLLFPGLDGIPTDSNGFVKVSFMPAVSIFSGEIPLHPIILHVLMVPTDGSEFEAGRYSVPVAVVNDENGIQFLPVTIDISAQTSAVTEWMVYR